METITVLSRLEAVFLNQPTFTIFIFAKVKKKQSQMRASTKKKIRFLFLFSRHFCRGILMNRSY